MPANNNPTVRDVRDRRNGRPKTRERTGPQIATAQFGLSQPTLATNYSSDWFNKVRVMRKDPTIALVRDLVFGPIIASEWSVGHKPKAPKGAVQLVADNLSDIRNYLVDHSLRGWMDFGWQAFEKVYGINSRGEAVLDKVKPLLQDITKVLVSTNTGEFLGTIQTPSIGKLSEITRIEGDLVFGAGMLRRQDVVLTNIGVEGTNWYGIPIMENVIIPYDGWKSVNAVADRYDSKIAGSHWVVYYPMGTSILDGARVDNFDIAEKLIQNLESSGAITVPRHLDETVHELNNQIIENGWKVELLSDTSSQQSNFVDRLAYYDSLKVRALGFPERSVLQGQFGTKAEAETHSDLAVVVAEYRHTRLTEQMSHQLVNDLVRFNYGREYVGTVFLKPAPIADDLKLFLRQVFLTLMQHDPETALKKIDADAMRERLQLPRNDGADDDSGFNFPEQEEQAEQIEKRSGDSTGTPGEEKSFATSGVGNSSE